MHKPTATMRVLGVVVEVKVLEQEALEQEALEQVALEQVGPDMVGVNLSVEKVARVRVVVAVRKIEQQVAWEEGTTLLKMNRPWCVCSDNVDLSTN